MITNQEFADSVIATLRENLASDDVAFFGSHRTGEADEYSDVDIRARIDRPLDELFFTSLTACIEERFGRTTVRYDPDYRDDPQTQDLRLTLYDFPIFWRIDLVVTSDCPTARKFPNPFPEWSVATSALWNLVWAVKYDRRNQLDAADEYMAAACGKVCVDTVTYSVQGVKRMLDWLSEKDDVDGELIDKLRGVLTA
ncbi:MAG: nucleotidyltransferase domain-containing protein [Chloroflexi bacterium]|nr:nucleotidyltransferase domain-containing protein [Chloroflexota bacterium]